MFLLVFAYQRFVGGCVGVRGCYLVVIICAMLLEAVVNRFIVEVRRGIGDDADGLFDVVVGPVVDCCSFAVLLEDE